MKISKVIMALIVALVLVSPVVMATEQTIGGVMFGDGNTQDLDNTLNVYDESQDASAVQIGGDHNTLTVTNNKAIQGQSQSQSMTLVIPDAAPSVSTLDSGTVQSMVYSTYSGRPFAFDFADANKADSTQKEGDVYSFGVRSALPTLAYVVNENDLARVLSDKDCAPRQDDFMNKFTFGNLDLAYKSKYRSTSQGFQVTVPKNGHYYLIIDNRVSRSLDGSTIPVTADSIDIALIAEKSSSGAPGQVPARTMIGVRDSFPTMANGMANTQA
jgi:hypothetical protein